MRADSDGIILLCCILLFYQEQEIEQREVGKNNLSSFANINFFPSVQKIETKGGRICET